MSQSRNSHNLVRGISATGSNDLLIGTASRKYRLLEKIGYNNYSAKEKKLIVVAVIIGLLLLIFFIAFCVTSSKYSDFKNICLTKDCLRTASTLLDTIDNNIDPCTDFYEYACGKWNEIRPTTDETYSWFAEKSNYLIIKMEDFLKENYTKDEPKAVWKAKTLYQSCIDTEELDKIGLRPVFEILKKIDLPDTIPNSNTVLNFNIGRVLAKAQRQLSMDILVALSLNKDPTSNKTLITISPGVGSSSLPDLIDENKDKRRELTSKELIVLTLAYMSNILEAIDSSSNYTDMTAIAFKILLIETRTKTDIRKTTTNYAMEKMTFLEFQNLLSSTNLTNSPNIKFNWKDYLEELFKGLNITIGLKDHLLVDNKDFFVLLAERLATTKAESYQRYIWWTIVNALIPHTTSTMRAFTENLDEAIFLRPKLSRSLKCVRNVKKFLNMALSYKFAAETDITKTSNKIKWMLKDIISSFNLLVSSFSWMDQQTKKLAKEKANAIKSFIGYPDWLLKPGELDVYYENVDVIEGQYLLSMVNIKAMEVNEILSNIDNDSTNDTHAWLSDPTDVNAYYAHAINSVAIPAGILQYPFYHLGLESLNYGAFGSILGHELTHAFDIEGKEYDSSGRKKPWWKDTMINEYNSRASCFIKQYDNFKVVADLSINGTVTLAENIADNGGVRESLHAYQLFKRRNGPEARLPGLEHLTDHQLFFLAYANVWCEKISDAISIQSIFADTHSPNKYRVIGTLSNNPDFATAWNCPKNSVMNPSNKCVLW